MHYTSFHLVIHHRLKMFRWRRVTRSQPTAAQGYSNITEMFFKAIYTWLQGAASLRSSQSPSWSRHCVFYRTWGFITVFTTVCHWSYPGPDESGAHLSFFICVRSIILLCSCLCWSLFLQGFLSGMLHMFSSFSCMWCVLPISFFLL